MCTIKFKLSWFIWTLLKAYSKPNVKKKAINILLVSNILNRKHITWIILHKNPSNMHLYTGCPRRNVPDFGRMFLMLKYNYITQNTYIQSWTVKEIMAREVWSMAAVTHLMITKYILKLAGICGFCNVNICT